MSSIVLLNPDGTIRKVTKFVSLPIDFIPDEGVIISWQERYELSFDSPMSVGRFNVPALGYFYFKEASASVDASKRPFDMTATIIVRVQGKKGAEVNELRDKILELIHKRIVWGVSNDFNPVPPKSIKAFFSRLFSW